VTYEREAYTAEYRTMAEKQMATQLMSSD